MKIGGKAGMWLAAALAALTCLMLLGNDGETQEISRDEKRIAEVLSAIAGAGKVEVAIFSLEETAAFGSSASVSAPVGAVIVAEGAEDIGVRLQLIRAAKTLLGLEENAVDVFVMEEGRK